VLLTLLANLELEGFHVVGASDAKQALRLIEEEPCDLVLTDIQMPGMSGVDLFRTIRRQRPKMPVILMTAFAAETLIAQAVQEGVFAVLPKPFDIEHVIFALTRALSSPTVLLVDAPDEVRPLAEALRAIGLASHTSSTPQTSVAAVRDGKADVVLVNVEALDDGPALVEAILRLNPSIAVIATSGSAAPELFRKVAELGAFACLMKPLQPQRLVQLVAHARARPQIGPRRPSGPSTASRG
jgi:DNA-binding NtrC family response regulator